MSSRPQAGFSTGRRSESKTPIPQGNTPAKTKDQEDYDRIFDEMVRSKPEMQYQLSSEFDSLTRNESIWRRNVEAQMEHERFLAKFGLAEDKNAKPGSCGLKVLERPYITSHVNVSKPVVQPKVSKPKKGIAQILYEQEPLRIFETFEIIAPHAVRIPWDPPTKSTWKKQKEDKYPVMAKVDSGLEDLRKLRQLGMISSDGPFRYKKPHQYLTIGPRLPENFGLLTYEPFRLTDNYTSAIRTKPKSVKSVNTRSGYKTRSAWKSALRTNKSQPSNVVEVLLAPAVNKPSSSMSTSLLGQESPAVNKIVKVDGASGASGTAKQKPQVPSTSVSKHPVKGKTAVNPKPKTQVASNAVKKNAATASNNQKRQGEPENRKNAKF